MIRSSTTAISKLSKRGRLPPKGTILSARTSVHIDTSLVRRRLSSMCLRNGVGSAVIDRQVSKRAYSSTTSSLKTVSITYIEADGSSKTVDAEVGKDLMTVAHDNDIELEGACGGELACSTCHLIFDADIYETLPEKEDEEDDMLDLAFEVTETSRLGCQIPVQENFDGMTVQIPDDGF